MFVTLRWANGYLRRHMEGRLQAIDAIVNFQRVPEAWLSRYRKRAARLTEASASPGVVSRLSEIARKRCLANIQELIRFVEDRGPSDTAATKHVMLTALRREKVRWRDQATWETLVDLTAPPVALPEMPDFEDEETD